MFVKEEYCDDYEKLFLLAGTSWEKEEELEKGNIKVVVQSSDQKNNTYLHAVLNDSEKVHAAVKEYKCNVCFKNFTRKHDLKKHMKIHSGIKDNKCNICFKEFTDKSNLNRHMKLHTGTKNGTVTNVMFV